MKVGFLKRLSFFSRRHSAALEIALGTLITCTFVSIFYYQGLRANKAQEKVLHSFEVHSQIQVVYGKLDEMNGEFQDSLPVGRESDADGWKITNRSLFGELQRLRELVSEDSVQLARVDRLNQLIREKQQHPDFSTQVRSVISSMLSSEYDEFRKQENIEEKFWQQNRILVRGGVLLLYFGLLVIVRVLERKNRRRHQLELSLRENDILTRAILDGGSHGIIISNQDRIITFFNRAAERITGHDSAYFVGTGANELINQIYLRSELEAEAERFSREAGRAVDIQEMFQFGILKYGTYEREWTAIRKDGTHIPISLTSTTLRDENGNIFGGIGIFQDISERKKLERMQMDFISTVSHELRTPLTSIRGALGLLDSPGLDSQKTSELISVAQRNSERLVKITNDILDVEKIEFGKLSLDSEPLQVEPFILQAMEANQTYGDKYGIRFVLKGSSCADLKVMADPDRLMQVMANLLSNAAKFSPRDSEVRIGADCISGRVHFSVQDSGPGIPENFRSRIFDKFAQANPGNNRDHAGSGLGLNISKRLVEAMGGSIRFETAMGKGTTFFFDLPQSDGVR